MMLLLLLTRLEWPFSTFKSSLTLSVSFQLWQSTIFLCVVVLDGVAVVISIFVVFVRSLEWVGNVVAVWVVMVNVDVVVVDVFVVTIEIVVVILDVFVDLNLRISVLKDVSIFNLLLWQFIDLLRSGRPIL